MSDDDRFDQFISRESKGYRAGVEPPAEVMWSRIEHDVARAIRRRQSPVARHWPWLAVGAGIAAALVIGVGIGQRMKNDARPPSSAVAESSATRSLASVDAARDAQMYAATLSHLVQTGVFLTEVRADLKTGRHDSRRRALSRQLLARTRLLMANDAARAPTVERLLQDVELVLAEIAALPDSGGRGSVDARLLDERLRGGTVLPRIRTILPSPPATVGL